MDWLIKTQNNMFSVIFIFFSLQQKHTLRLVTENVCLHWQQSSMSSSFCHRTSFSAWRMCSNWIYNTKQSLKSISRALLLLQMHHVVNHVSLRNKTYVPVFYRGNKTWVWVWVRMNYITRALAVVITRTRTSTHGLLMQ